MLKNIRETVGAIAPRLYDGTLNPEQKATILNSVTRDLPGTISDYLRLPAAYANVHAVEKGKTCKHLLLDQLEILDIQVRTNREGNRPMTQQHGSCIDPYHSVQAIVVDAIRQRHHGQSLQFRWTCTGRC